MSRKIELEDNQLVIKLSGITSVAALKRHVNIPFDSLEKVTIKNFDVPLMQFRVGTSVSDIREGRFLLDGKWCFVSYENHENLLILDLVDHEYDKVIIQVENPIEAKRELEERLQKFKA